MNTNNELELKLWLVKRLPVNTFKINGNDVLWYNQRINQVAGIVKETEWLYICWLVEEQLDKVGDLSEPPEIRSMDIEWSRYVDCLFEQQDGSSWTLTHSTWPQRAEALRKVLGECYE